MHWSCERREHKFVPLALLPAGARSLIFLCMKVDVVLLPRDLPVVADRAVAVFDVLRATTSMAAALAAGVREIRIFSDVQSARAAAADFAGKKLLCGEAGCLPPPGFDLGNSPGAFSPQHAGCTLFMATTNGTRALIAAQGARETLAAALVNAESVARRLHQLELNVILLCAGTHGVIAMEDLLGCGAVLDSLLALRPLELESDAARMALRLFRAARDNLVDVLREAQGGRNVIKAGLLEDVDFAARLNSLTAVGRVVGNPLPAEQAVRLVRL
jgi:2-phosphosulfolactate phosphatase